VVDVAGGTGLVLLSPVPIAIAIPGCVSDPGARALPRQEPPRASGEAVRPARFRVSSPSLDGALRPLVRQASA